MLLLTHTSVEMDDYTSLATPIGLHNVYLPTMELLDNVSYIATPAGDVLSQATLLCLGDCRNNSNVVRLVNLDLGQRKQNEGESISEACLALDEHMNSQLEPLSICGGNEGELGQAAVDGGN